jgi:SAM-dependent methyltransferase
MRRHGVVSVADRAVLTEVVLPALRQEVGGADVLFVGVEWYTAGYDALFPDGNLVTVDIDERQQEHGSARHVIADVRELARHFDPGSFGAVVCNGVIGHGLDAPDDVDQALAAMARCLAPGGTLVVGWNDTDELRVPGLEAAARAAGLVPSPGAGLPEWRSAPLGPLRHTYDVYRRLAR